MFPKMSLQSMSLTSASKSAPVASGGGGGTEYDIDAYDGQTITEEGDLVSPGYPTPYSTSGDTSWSVTLEAPVGQTIQVTVTEFDTTNTWYQRGLTGYNAGSATPIINKIYGSAVSNTGTFSGGTTLPIVFSSTGNEMTIVFDDWGASGTWKAEVAFV